MENKDVSVELKDNTISAKFDSDNDGTPSVGLNVRPFEIYKELKDKGEGATVEKKIVFKMEGTRLVGMVDSDGDGVAAADLYVDSIETIDEILKRV